MDESTNGGIKIITPVSSIDLEIFDAKGRLLARCYREDVQKHIIHHYNACASILRLIGNVDHTKGNGTKSAKLRGQLLNDIRSILEDKS